MGIKKEHAVEACNLFLFKRHTRDRVNAKSYRGKGLFIEMLHMYIHKIRKVCMSLCILQEDRRPKGPHLNQCLLNVYTLCIIHQNIGESQVTTNVDFTFFFTNYVVFCSKRPLHRTVSVDL